MNWALIFWAVYGVGSILFVVYLFRVGKSVASNQKEIIQRELRRIRAEGADPAVCFAAEVAHAASRGSASDQATQLQVQRIYQPDDQHVVVEGVRDGSTCIVNLPIGLGAGVAAVQTRESRSVEKVS
ncbi:MAG: hypothetical protein JSW48_13405 [Betaproteobacteria bacterium]|jgi:hypothetical protein|nr:MAG: hypothetical protein JSW48_13405 [Betaproteobacteria bacterium]